MSNNNIIKLISTYMDNPLTDGPTLHSPRQHPAKNLKQHGNLKKLRKIGKYPNFSNFSDEFSDFENFGII